MYSNYPPRDMSIVFLIPYCLISRMDIYGPNFSSSLGETYLAWFIASFLILAHNTRHPSIAYLETNGWIDQTIWEGFYIYILFLAHCIGHCVILFFICHSLRLLYLTFLPPFASVASSLSTLQYLQYCPQCTRIPWEVCAH